MGTPPQNVSMVIDTGSELSWLHCKIPKISPPFASPTTSPAASPVQSHATPPSIAASPIVSPSSGVVSPVPTPATPPTSAVTPMSSRRGSSPPTNHTPPLPTWKKQRAHTIRQDCGEVTASGGVGSLLDCKALEDLLLRHNGPGIKRDFILDAASRMPMLRKISLDFCDASEGDLEIPNYDDRCFLSIVKIARCKFQKCTLDLQILEARRRPVHKETLVLVWNSKNLIKTMVKERV